MGFLKKLFSRDKKEKLDKGLQETKVGFLTKIKRAIAGKSKIDDELLDNLEEALITSDVGVETTVEIIRRLKERVQKDKFMSTEELSNIIADEICEMIGGKSVDDDEREDDFEIDKSKGTPYVIMVVGVNGVGKTTTIAKLAHKYKKAGNKVVLGAADTFRAGAITQLSIWGERVDVPVVTLKEGSKPDAVAYKTLEYAKANNADVVIIDTAGRLHNKAGLMDELSKVKRVMQKIEPEAPQEVLLILDGSTGQNAINQAKAFIQATDVNCIAVTKLDGTAKGGVVIGICDQFKIPVKYIGIGEQLEDMQIFRPTEFVKTLFEDAIVEK